MSKTKKQQKKHKDDLSFIDSDSDWETDHSSTCPKKKENKSNGPKRVEKSFQVSSMCDDVEEIIKEKTVCEDGVQVLHSSAIKIKLKQQEKTKNEQENYGPLRMAPDPTQKIFVSNEQEPSLRPQRQWEPEQGTNCQNQNSVVNNWPIQHQGKNMEFNRSPLPYNRSPLPYRNNEENQVSTPQNPKCVEKTSYHISSTGEDGEEIMEESSIRENGFQVYHSSAYKKKMKRLEKLKQKNTEELESMKRKVATRFLLTKAKPSMSEEAVECYILENFDVDEVYVRKNAMKHPNYSSFIFIVNSDEELDTDEFEEHEWPGLLKCFFAPNEQNRRN